MGAVGMKGKRMADDGVLELLLEEIDREMAYAADLLHPAKLDARVRAALREVPRQAFVPDAAKPYALENRPLSIGCGQTISQPFIVALMTQLLQPRADSNILEIGGGSGYQAAVLSRLVRRVWSLEILPELADAARRRLAGLGYGNVEVLAKDGYHGLPEHAPYDGILVAAASPRVPPQLIEQLALGGRLVIPLGMPYGRQDLWLYQKATDGQVEGRPVLPVAFVPLTGEGGVP